MQKYKTVEEFIDNLDDTKLSQVEALRSIIFDVEPRLKEHVKWNAPSYVLDGEDRITFSIRNKQDMVKLVLHMGATRKENKHGTPVMKDLSGLIEWSSDVRGTITFSSIEDINSKLSSIKQVLEDWLSIPSAT